MIEKCADPTKLTLASSRTRGPARRNAQAFANATPVANGQEEIYLKAYDTVSEARASLGCYLDFYNRALQHPPVYVIEAKRLC